MIELIYAFFTFVPAIPLLLFCFKKNNKYKTDYKMSDENFTVFLPMTVAIIGAMLAITTTTVVICSPLMEGGIPPFGFYIFFGMFFWLGMYLIVKTLAFRVIVCEKITVISVLKKPYSFSFSDISMAKRQVKNNNVKSERVVIETTTGKRLIVERAEVSYERFKKILQSKLNDDICIGF